MYNSLTHVFLLYYLSIFAMYVSDEPTLKGPLRAPLSTYLQNFRLNRKVIVELLSRNINVSGRYIKFFKTSSGLCAIVQHARVYHCLFDQAIYFRFW